MKLLRIFLLSLSIAAMVGNISAQTQKPVLQPTFESLEKVNPAPE